MHRPTPGRLRDPLRVVVVDDHQMVLDGLRAMLAALPSAKKPSKHTPAGSTAN
jgi:hypothetical protein